MLAPRSARPLPAILPRAVVPTLFAALVVSLLSLHAPQLHAAPPPGATVLEYPPLDLRLTLAVEGATVCVLVPEVRSDPAACGEVDLARAREVRAANPAQSDKAVGVALVRFPDWTATVAIARLAGPTGLWTDRDMEAFAEGLAASIHASFPDGLVRGTTPGSAYDDVHIGDRRVVRWFIDLAANEASPNAAVARQVGYALTGDGGIVLVSFMGDVRHQAELQRIATTTMDTVELRPPGPDAHFGPDADPAGRRSARLLLGITPFFALIVVALVLLQSRRRSPPRG